jgi:hypothetical protein
MSTELIFVIIIGDGEKMSLFLKINFDCCCTKEHTAREEEERDMKGGGVDKEFL